MKELNTFRQYLTEGEFKVGDKVTMKGGGDSMEITNTRKMLGSDLKAYSVKKSDGKTAEYDENQLELAEEVVKENDKNDYANSEEDFTDEMVVQKIKDIIKYHELDPQDVIDEIRIEFGVDAMD